MLDQVKKVFSKFVMI